MFWPSFALTVASEIGDKTFFIGAILAVSKGRLPVFLAIMLSMLIMISLSMLVGVTIPLVLSQSISKYLVPVIFGYFGLSMLWESLPKKLRARTTGGKKGRKVQSNLKGEIEAKEAVRHRSKSLSFLQCVWLICMAEMGDRSQASVIGLASSKEVSMSRNLLLASIFFGSLLGQAVSAVLAVCFGRLVGERLDDDTLNVASGALFLGFGIIYALF